MSPLTPNHTSNTSIQIPENFDDFLKVFHEKVAGMESRFRMFLSVPSPVKYEISAKSSSFAFSPADRVIHIPQKWLQVFHTNLLRATQSGVVDGPQFAYTWEDLFFGLFHELSHFRDLLMESKKTGRASMKTFLDDLQKEQIPYGADKRIPIGSHLHTLFNCIDDIIVNKEVEMFSGSTISAAHLQDFYKYNLFADRIEDANGEYDENLVFVGTGKGTCCINTTNTVDYTKSQLSQSLPYFLLRAAMVRDQDILLPKPVSDIIFADDTKKRKNPWKTSVIRTMDAMQNAFSEASTSSNPKIQERAKSLKIAYESELILLRKMTEKSSVILPLLQESITRTESSKKFIAENISLIDCIALFCASHGREADHMLDISPALRYKIYSELFLPIQKAYIIMDLLKQDLPESKAWEGDWEWDPNKSGNKEGKWKEKWDKKDGEPQSGSDSVHVSPDIQSKLDFLDDVDAHEAEKEAKELTKKIAEKVSYDTSSILEWTPVGEGGKKILSDILTSESAMIEDLVQFFLKQIQTLDRREVITSDFRKKWKLSTTRLREYIASNPEATDIHTKSLYEKNEVTEALTDDYRKMDCIFAIDISGSMDMYKSNKMVHIIPTVLFIAMKHLEAHLRDWLEDPLYEIPVHFMLYGNGLPYSSFTSPYAKAIDSVRMAEMNEQIRALSGGTNDATAWTQIAHEFDEKLTIDKAYTKEILSGKRCPVILQIADSDVTEDGVYVLRETFASHLWDEKTQKNIAIKRVILGNIHTQTLSKEEYEARKHSWQLGNWDAKYLPDGTVQLKEISVKSKKEILGKIKELFSGFLAESFTITR